MWFVFVASAVIVMSGSSIFDSFLSNRRFSSGLSLALYSAVLNIIFIPVVAIIDPPGVPPLSLLPVFLLASLLDIAFLIPYYKAMQIADASVVSALFSFSRIFVPLFAYFIIGEQLALHHYVGFALIVVAGVALAGRAKEVFRPSRAFWLMLLSSLLVSLDSVLYKYQLEQVSWGTSMIWGSLFTVPWLIVISLGLAGVRHQMRASLPAFRQSWRLIFANETVTFTALALSMYAVYLAPISQVSAIWGVQPFIILGLAYVFKKFGVRGVLEDVSRGGALRKVLIFTIMLMGVLLVRE